MHVFDRSNVSVAAVEPPSRPRAGPSRHIRLITTPPARSESRRRRTDQETHELKLTFGELALIYKSLQAVKTLGSLPPQDELLNDTIQLVDQALNKAI